MAMRRHRAKDVAASYLARICPLDLPWDQDLARRADASSKLRKHLLTVHRG